MLEVKIDNIVPVTEARDSFNQLVDRVEGSDDMFVLTKNGKPSAILVGVHHLEKLTGTSHEELMGEMASSEAAPAAATVAETVTETPPLETPASPEPPIATTPTAEPATSVDSMDSLQDSPFAYDDDSTAATIPVAPSPTPPVSPAPSPQIPSDANPFPAQDSQTAAPQAPLNDNNPL